MRSSRFATIVSGLSVATLLCLSAASLRGADEPTLRAGAAPVDITPKTFAGLWMLWGQPFDGVHGVWVLVAGRAHGLVGQSEGKRQ